MSTQELPFEPMEEQLTQRRVVEAEIKMPKLEDLKLPKVDLSPFRSAAVEVVLTGLGVGVLIDRGMVGAVKAAHAAGAEEIKNPGPLTKAFLDLLRPDSEAAAKNDLRIKVPVMPLDNYDTLAIEDIVNRLADLSVEQLHVVHEYELAHQARPAVVEAIDQRLAGA